MHIRTIKNIKKNFSLIKTNHITSNPTFYLTPPIKNQALQTITGYKYYPIPESEMSATMRKMALRLQNDTSIEDMMDELTSLEAECTEIFEAAAMSLGAISPEMQMTITEAFNRMSMHNNRVKTMDDLNKIKKPRGPMSNSGEGGSLREWDGTVWDSPIKQIGTARWGVNTDYVSKAKVLQIKYGQAAKPGQGGQLPEEKVTDTIANTRFTEKNIPLVSPAPHHNLYSIEELKRAIEDFSEINPDAEASVKLVGTYNIEVVAVGVAKCGANRIEIAGLGGGTGATPVSARHDAAHPWVGSLAACHQKLTMQGIREKVELCVSGGIQTARDVIIAILLGANRVSIGTGLLIAGGCIKVDLCHTNDCPTGIATQKQDLIDEKFKGKPEDIARMIISLAKSLAAYLEYLGFSHPGDAVGHTEKLRLIKNPKLKGMEQVLFQAVNPYSAFLFPTQKKPISYMNQAIIHRIQQGETKIHLKASNLIHAFGGYLAHRKKKDPEFRAAFTNPVQIIFNGLSLGQSAGYFLPRDVVLVVPHTNDSTCISMDGGITYTNTAGNQTCFGATQGKFYARFSGERTGIRNSGAFIMVEWTGSYFLNYMTRGQAMILGKPDSYSQLQLFSEYKPPVLLRDEELGPNFGASWTGGVCYMPKLLYQTKLRQGYFADSAKLIKAQDLSEEDVDLIIQEMKNFDQHLDSPIVKAFLKLDEIYLREAIHHEFFKLDAKVKLKEELKPQLAEIEPEVENIQTEKTHLNEVFEILPKGSNNPLPGSGMTTAQKESDACGTGVYTDLSSSPSREIVEKGQKFLQGLMARGASGIDPQTGDGCGSLWYGTYGFFQAKFPELDLKKENFGVVHIALPSEQAELERAMQFFNNNLKESSLQIAGVRNVPINPDVMGELCRRQEAAYKQFIIIKPEQVDIESFEKQLIRMQFRFECLVENEKFNIRPHILSASAHYVIYKTMAKEDQFANYFLDMLDPLFLAIAVIVHSRFATNALPAKELIQPFPGFAHNGEINSIQLLVEWMSKDPVYKNLLNLADLDFRRWSDSKILSFYMNMLYLMGKTPEQIIASITQAYSPKNPQASIVNNLFNLPAEGPMAGVMPFGDSIYLVRCKGGLRPLKGIVNQQRLYCGSELGPIEMEGDILSPPPGQAFKIDLKTNQYGMCKVAADDQAYYENQLQHFKKLSTDHFSLEPIQFSPDEFNLRKLRAGWSDEVDRLFIQPYFKGGKGLIVSMGDQGPLEPLVKGGHNDIAALFKMDFRQVTAPTIAKTEEKNTMSTDVFVGVKPDLQVLHNTMVDGWHLSSPLINNFQMQELQNDPSLKAKTIDTIFPVKNREKGMKKAIKDICHLCVNLVREKNVSLLVLSDLKSSDDFAAIPPVIITALVNDALLKAGLRRKVTIAVQAASLLRGIDIAQVITIGGANVINPYLPLIGAREKAAVYLESLRDELLAFMAKAGIYSVSGYFKNANAYGVDRELADALGIPTTFEGTGYTEITTMVLNQHESPKPQGLGRFEGQNAGPRKGIWNSVNTLGLTKVARGIDKDFPALEKKMNALREGTLQGQLEIKASQHWNKQNLMHICILGGGAAGFYQAKTLLDTGLPFKIVMIDQNPVNRVGLVGDGIAPDHGNTKKTIYRMCRKIVENEANFEYYGGVTIGDKKGTGNVDLQTLKSIYPVVIDCRGASKDKQLSKKVKGAHLTLPASAVYKPYNNAHHYNSFKNGMPLFSNSINRELGIIGGGNVALDVLRVCCKNPRDLENTNIAPEFLSLLKSDPPAVVHLFIREMPMNVLMGLNGLLALEKLGVFISSDFDESQIKTDEFNEDQKSFYAFFKKYHNLAKPKIDDNRKQIHFHFGYNANKFKKKGNDIEGQFISDKKVLKLEAKAFITAIGYDVLTNNDPDILESGFRKKPGNLQSTETHTLEGTQIVVKKFLEGDYNDRMDPPPAISEWQEKAPVGKQEFLNILDWCEQGRQIKTTNDFRQAKQFKPEKPLALPVAEIKTPALTQKEAAPVTEPEANPDKVTVLDRNEKTIAVFDANSHDTILRGLQKNGIELECDCNGKLVCGKCMVALKKAPDNFKQDEKEENVLEANLESGQNIKKYALTCAHNLFSFKGAHIKLLNEQITANQQARHNRVSRE